jgi:hypothetical protein
VRGKWPQNEDPCLEWGISGPLCMLCFLQQGLNVRLPELSLKAYQNLKSHQMIPASASFSLQPLRNTIKEKVPTVQRIKQLSSLLLCSPPPTHTHNKLPQVQKGAWSFLTHTLQFLVLCSQSQHQLPLEKDLMPHVSLLFCPPLT